MIISIIYWEYIPGGLLLRTHSRAVHSKSAYVESCVVKLNVYKCDVFSVASFRVSCTVERAQSTNKSNDFRAQLAGCCGIRHSSRVLAGSIVLFPFRAARRFSSPLDLSARFFFQDYVTFAFDCSRPLWFCPCSRAAHPSGVDLDSQTGGHICLRGSWDRRLHRPSARGEARICNLFSCFNTRVDLPTDEDHLCFAIAVARLVGNVVAVVTNECPTRGRHRRVLR